MEKVRKVVIAVIIVFIIVLYIENKIYQMPSREDLRIQREEEEHDRKMWEDACRVKENFDGLVAYCEEHEEDLMKISKEFISHCSEGMTEQEIWALSENNTFPEWKELSKTLVLWEPIYNMKTGHELYYAYQVGGGTFSGILYLDIDNLDEETISYYTDKEWAEFLRKVVKINDYLYVCIHEIPYT